MILAAKGKDKESRKQLKQGSKKNISFFSAFCQFSSKHELHSYTRFKTGIHHLQHLGSNIEQQQKA
jgi:hypothetical protein